MLQNTGNCVGFISEIWEIKPPLCTSLNPKFYTITFSGFHHCHPQAFQAQNKTKNPSKNLFKTKADFFFNLVNAKHFGQS